VVQPIGILLLVSGLSAFGGSAWADEGGSAAEARAMLERALVALKVDEAKALAAFTAGGAAFRAKDLYVFCVDPTGVVTANGGHPDHIGRDTHAEVDADGKNIGDAILAAAQQGEVHAATYLYPKPGSEEPALKTALIGRVADQICGVGYYGA
jgi:hypothetical protein